MSMINYASREINCKIVYYGPGLGGKTTNLEHVYGKVKPDTRGKLISLATETERTLFFDFLPVDLGTIRGFKTRFHLYTVPGQVYYNASRKLILKGVDGIVFVADSQIERMEANQEAMQNLYDNMAEYGYDLHEDAVRDPVQQTRSAQRVTVDRAAGRAEPGMGSAGAGEAAPLARPVPRRRKSRGAGSDRRMGRARDVLRGGRGDRRWRVRHAEGGQQVGAEVTGIKARTAGLGSGKKPPTRPARATGQVVGSLTPGPRYLTPQLSSLIACLRPVRLPNTVNLPNALTIGRIAIAPVLALLALASALLFLLLAFAVFCRRRGNGLH